MEITDGWKLIQATWWGNIPEQPAVFLFRCQDLWLPEDASGAYWILRVVYNEKGGTYSCEIFRIGPRYTHCNFRLKSLDGLVARVGAELSEIRNRHAPFPPQPNSP